MLENVFNAIEENMQLDLAFKEDIKALITIFNKFFPEISLGNFAERAKTLRIEKINRLVSKRVYNYNPMTNVLSFSLEHMQGDYDAKHVLMSALLCIITANGNSYGFDRDNKLVSLNVGYTEILSNFLVGNESDTVLFEDEIIATNIISEIIGRDLLFEAYFSNNPKLISDAIVDADESFKSMSGGSINVTG